MRRVLIGLSATATAFTLLGFAGSASATTGQVIQARGHGPFAVGEWATGPGPTASFTLVDVNTLDVPLGVVPNVTESQLSVDQITGNQDSGLNFTSGTDTFADVTSGFSFDIDKAQLTTATLSASGIPATTCALDANGNDINCTPTTIDVTVTWTGTGIIDRSSFNQLLKLQHGVSVVVLNQHVNGTSRSATTTGTFDGSPITGFGSGGTLGFANQSQIYLCRGDSC